MHEQWPGIRVENLALHAAMEAAGAVISLLVALLLFYQMEHRAAYRSMIWGVASLTLMGFLDGAHSVLPFGAAFVWSRAASTLLGGIFFGLMWYRPPVQFLRNTKLLFCLFASLSLAFVIAIYGKAEELPPMSIGGLFTNTAVALNLIGGFGYFCGFLYFRSRQNVNSFAGNKIFSLQCLLLSVAGLLFSIAYPWGPAWWLFHFLRLVSYVIVLGYLVASFLKVVRVREQEAEHLAAREEEMKAVMEALPVGVMLADAEGRIYEMNRAAKRNWGMVNFLPISDYKGFRGCWGGTKEPLKASDWALRRAILRRETCLGEVVDIVAFDDVEKTLLVAAVPIFVNGKLIGGVSVAQDITDLKRAERDVHLRDEFISVCSHELKTPVTSLKLQLDHTRRKLAHDPALVLDRKALNRLLDIGIKQMSRLTRLIEDMLDVARVNQGRLNMQLEETNLTELAKEAFEALAEQFEAAHVPVKFLAESEERIEADGFRIEQVISNLLTNALKYGNGKPVEMKVYRSGRFAVVSVEDRGPGIAEENLGRIFDRFERVSETKQISGMGLGLYISRNIVEKHGGSISVESKLGVGTTFRVSFPRKG